MQCDVLSCELIIKSLLFHEIRHFGVLMPLVERGAFAYRA